MKKLWTFSDYHFLMRKVNPLGLRNEWGELLLFQRQADCFLQLLSYVFERFPQGYVEIPIIMANLQKLDQSIIYSVCDRCDTVLVPTWKESDERNKALRAIIDIISRPYAISLDEQQIALSIFYFDTYLSKYKPSDKEITVNIKKV